VRLPHHQGSYYEGKTCPLAHFGRDRDGKTGCAIIVYGVLTDADGRPVAVQVYPGNTADPKTVPDQVEALAKRFGLSRVVLAGDRGMLTQTQSAGPEFSDFAGSSGNTFS
jgi:transposase